MVNINFENTEFLTTVAESKQFLRSTLPCIAIAGKSNVGKSSFINSLSRHRNLAKVGKKPGKTANINYYVVDGKVYLADLPGYGYAKVGKHESERWAELMESFFTAKDTFSAGLLIVDGRHEPGQNDMIMCDLYIRSKKPFLVVANKMDKVNRGEWREHLDSIRSALNLPEEVRLLAYSAQKDTGRNELIQSLQSIM